MNFGQNGPGITGTPPPFSQVLRVDENHVVGTAYSGESIGAVNVIFNPQFGLAYVYAANNENQVPNWRNPPSVEQLEPIVNRIFNSYIGPAGALRPWPERPIADILVRVPRSQERFEGSVYKVVPRDYDPTRSNCGDGTEKCGLADQLADLETLEGLGIGDNPSFPWTYSNPVGRINDMISANSGDIVLLANGRDGYQFGVPYRGQHGGLTHADSIVPVAFGFPSATGNIDEDNTLKSVIDFLEGFQPDPIEALVEAPAILTFFGIDKPVTAPTQ